MKYVLLVLILTILFFGARRLPEIGKALGQSIRNFRKGLKGKEEDDLRVVSGKKDEED